MELEMLDVKEAAQRASEYFANLYADRDVSNIQLEEVELSDDGKYWLITLSYPDHAAFLTSFKRKYKVFTIDAATGEVKSMKIRTVE
jgi:hypothetical protein